MSIITTNWKDLIHKTCIEVKVDWPLSYKEFCENQQFSDLIEYINREYYFSRAINYNYASNVVSESILDKVSIYFRNDITDYYENVKDDLKSIAWHYYTTPETLKKREKERAFLKDFNSTEKSRRFEEMISELKAIWNNNKILTNKKYLEVERIRIWKMLHKKRIGNPQIYESGAKTIRRFLRDDFKRSKSEFEYKTAINFFKNHHTKQEIKKNKLLSYLFFISFFAKKNFYIVINGIDSVILCEEKYLAEVSKGFSAVIYLYENFSGIYNKIQQEEAIAEVKNLREKYKNLIEETSNDENSFEVKKKKLINDVSDFMERIQKNGTLKIAFSKQWNYLHMEWQFTNENVNNYNELRWYIWGFWDLWKKRYNDKTVWLKWAKSFFYNKEKSIKNKKLNKE